MKQFTVLNLSKWMHQNNAEYTGAFVEGCLLDNYVLDCKRGYAAVYEHYQTPNSSIPLIEFAPYKDKAACDELWSRFYRFEKRSAV